MSDRIAVFSTGRIEQVGTPREIYERPVNEFVAGFVGTSNIVERDGRRFTVRPEKIRLLRADAPAPDGELSELGASRGRLPRRDRRATSSRSTTAGRSSRAPERRVGRAAASEERGRRVRLAWRRQHMMPWTPRRTRSIDTEEVPQ